MTTKRTLAVQGLQCVLPCTIQVCISVMEFVVSNTVSGPAQAQTARIPEKASVEIVLLTIPLTVFRIWIWSANVDTPTDMPNSRGSNADKFK